MHPQALIRPLVISISHDLCGGGLETTIQGQLPDIEIVGLQRHLMPFLLSRKSLCFIIERARAVLNVLFPENIETMTYHRLLDCHRQLRLINTEVQCIPITRAQQVRGTRVGMMIGPDILLQTLRPPHG